MGMAGRLLGEQSSVGYSLIRLAAVSNCSMSYFKGSIKFLLSLPFCTSTPTEGGLETAPKTVFAYFFAVGGSRPLRRRYMAAAL